MEVDVLTINAQPAIKSVASLKEEIKDLKSQLLNLEQGTEEYNKTLLQLGDAQHELVELNQQMRATTTDFGDQLGNVTRSIAGMSGAVQAVTGTLALMGVEIGDDAKLMKILVAAMSITQGVAAIDSGIKAFKALRISIQAATAAQKGFNLAALKNPYLIAGAAIVAAIVAITKALQRQKQVEKEQHDARMQQLREQIELSRQAVIEESDRRAELAKYAEEVSKLTQEEIDKKKELEKQNLKVAQAEYESRAADVRKAMQQIDELNKIIEARKRLGRDTSENEAELHGLVETASALQEKSHAAAQNVVLINEKIKILNGTVGKTAQTTKATTKEMKDEYTLYEKLANAIDLADAKGQEEIVTLQQKINLEKMHLTELEEGTKAYDKQLVVIAQLEGEMTKMVQAKVQENIEAEKAHKLSVAETEALEKQITLMQTARSIGEPKTFGDIDEQKEQALALAEFTKQTKLETLQANYEAEMEALNQELTLTETTEERKREIQDETQRLTAEYRLNNLEAEQEYADKVVEIESEALEKRKTLQNQYIQFMLFMANQVGSILSSMSDMAEQGTKEWKNLKIAEAIINTIAGAVAAMMSVWKDESVPSVWMKIAMMATLGASTLATGFAQVAKIRSTQVSKAASGGNTNSMTVQSLTNTPTNVRQTSPTWNDEGVIQDTLVNQGDQRVVLVMSDLEAAGATRTQIASGNSY